MLIERMTHEGRGDARRVLLIDALQQADDAIERLERLRSRLRRGLIRGAVQRRAAEVQLAVEMPDAMRSRQAIVRIMADRRVTPK